MSYTSMNLLFLLNISENLLFGVGFIFVFFVIGLIAFIFKMYKKAAQGEAIVRTGVGGTYVSFSGILVFPIIHKMEKMDITLKIIPISRQGKEGLSCKDNLRANIKVTFFVRVNNTEIDVINVATSVGCKRTYDPKTLLDLFEGKFSEALKTIGKQFNFVELYTSPDIFRQKIIEVIGTDLNGYILDDCSIDYLEQTPISDLDPNNILDAEAIKKITELTSPKN